LALCNSNFTSWQSNCESGVNTLAVKYNIFLYFQSFILFCHTQNRVKISAKTEQKKRLSGLSDKKMLRRWPGRAGWMKFNQASSNGWAK
jgi:hypothetical protein